MVWVCWAHVLLRLAPEPETTAASFKQDEVGKMEHITAIILSELLPCHFTQFSPFRVFAPISLHRHRGAKTRIGKCRRFFHPCACQRLCCQTGFGFLRICALQTWTFLWTSLLQAVTTDRWIENGSLFMHSLGSKTVLSVKGGFPKIARNLKNRNGNLGLENLGLGGPYFSTNSRGNPSLCWLGRGIKGHKNCSQRFCELTGVS